MKNLLLILLCVSAGLFAWAAPSMAVNGEGMSLQRFMSEKHLTPADNALTAKIQASGNILSDTRLVFLNCYQGVELDDNPGIDEIVPASPMCDGGWKALATQDQTSGISFFKDFYDGLCLPYVLDESTGNIVIGGADPVVISYETKVGMLRKEKTTMTIHILNENDLFEADPICLRRIQGEVYNDGSIHIQAGFAIWAEVVTTVFNPVNGQVLSEDTVIKESPIFRDTYLMTPNGKHSYEISLTGGYDPSEYQPMLTSGSGGSETTGMATNKGEKVVRVIDFSEKELVVIDGNVSFPRNAVVYMYQLEDTVFVWNLYNMGWRGNSMMIDGNSMTWPCQPICDLGDGAYWYNYHRYRANGPEGDVRLNYIFHWVKAPGNTGTASPEAITWGETLFGDRNDHWSSSYYTDNKLSFTNGGQFDCGTSLAQVQSPISAVTELIDGLLEQENNKALDYNNDGTVDVQDVSVLIDKILSAK